MVAGVQLALVGPPPGALPGQGPIGVGPFDLAAGIPAFPFPISIPDFGDITFPTGQLGNLGATFPRVIVDPGFRPGDDILAVGAGIPLEGVFIDGTFVSDVEIEAAFPLTGPLDLRDPSPEAIAEGAPRRRTTFVALPVPLPRGDGGGGLMANLIDLLSAGIGAVRDVALTPGGQAVLTGNFGDFGGFGGAFSPIRFDQVNPATGRIERINGDCPAPRPRLPAAFISPDPCSPHNPTVYLNAGKVSSMLSPKILKQQNKRFMDMSKRLPRKTVRRRKGK